MASWIPKEYIEQYPFLADPQRAKWYYHRKADNQFFDANGRQIDAEARTGIKRPRGLMALILPHPEDHMLPLPCLSDNSKNIVDVVEGSGERFMIEMRGETREATKWWKIKHQDGTETKIFRTWAA